MSRTIFSFTRIRVTRFLAMTGRRSARCIRVQRDDTSKRTRCNSHSHEHAKVTVASVFSLYVPFPLFSDISTHAVFTRRGIRNERRAGVYAGYLLSQTENRNSKIAKSLLRRNRWPAARTISLCQDTAIYFDFA